MARKSKQDAAKAKEAKQKKIAIGGFVLLALLLVIPGPKTLKRLHQTPAPPMGATATPGGTAVTPADPNSLAAPTLVGSSTVEPLTSGGDTSSASNLVAAVPVKADTGQLQTFEKFASKDPFDVQVDPSAVSSAPKTPTASPAQPSTSTPTLTTVTPTAPAPAAPTTAAISVNGEVLSVAVGTDFPSSGATFARVGAVFHLVSLTAKTAKIAIAGGSYADGSPAITLKLNKPLTLQNTADGTKYTLVLQPPPTAVSAAGASTTSTTPAAPVVPATGSGG